MWWEILKVDIDFSDEPRGLGHFQGHTFDSSRDNIKINHKRIYNYLKGKLDREPTEKEIEEYEGDKRSKEYKELVKEQKKARAAIVGNRTGNSGSYY